MGVLVLKSMLLSIIVEFGRFKAPKGRKGHFRFPDRELKFPEQGNFSSGPEKSGNPSLQSLILKRHVKKPDRKK